MTAATLALKPKTTSLINSAPVINTSAAVNVIASYAGAINGLSITDAFAGANALQVTLTDSHGLLNVGGASGVGVYGANTANLTLSGSLSAINSALASLTDANATLGADPISISVVDAGDGLTASASQSVNVISPLTLSGLTTAGTGGDTGALNPFANLVLTDNLPQDSVSVSISFNAANGALSGAGLSAAALNNGTVAYTLSSANPGQLQQELNALVFTPTAHQVSPGLSVTTQFTLNFNGGGVGAAPNTPSLTLSDGVSSPYALATDSVGDAWVANQDTNTVSEYSAAGALLLTLSNGFSSPDALAADSSGDVFVANQDNNTVEEFSASGVLLRTLSNGVSEPQTLSTDNHGDIFVANNGNNSVEDFSASGALLNTLSNVSGALATDSGGDVFVTNYFNNTVEEFSASGVMLRTLNNNLYGPYALAADNNGDVFVGNVNNNTVAEFSASGNLLHVLPDISNPTLLTTDSSGDVFVNNGNNAVKEFSASGALLRTLSNGVSNPLALTTDSNGDVFVNNSNNTVSKFAPIPASYTLSNNATSVQITASALPPDINTGATATVVAGYTGAINGLSITDAAASGANLQVTLSDSQGVLNIGVGGVTVNGANTAKLTLSGNISAINNALASLTDANPVPGSDPINVSVTDTGDGLGASASQSVNIVPPLSLSGLTTAGSGSDASAINPFANLTLTDNLVLTNNLPQDVVDVGISFTAANGVLSGSGLSAAAISNGVATYTLNAASPSQIQQELNALLFKPTAHQVSPGLSVTTHFTLSFNGGGPAAVNVPSLTLSSGVDYPNALATDSSGDVFVGNLSNNTVEEFSAAGDLMRTLSDGVSVPYALAADSAGDVFVANYNNNSVEEFSANGIPLRGLSNGVSGPDALAADNAGDVFVSNYGNNTVEEFSAGGVLLHTLSSGVSGPHALTTDGNGDVFVANQGNNTVEEFSPGGILLHTLSGGVSSPRGLAADSNGNVFVSNWNNSTVEEFSAGGALLRTLNSGLSRPSALAIDGSGDLFVTNGGGAVKEFSAGGALLRTLSNGVSTPIALTTDGSGNVFVANDGNNTVTKYGPVSTGYTLSNSATSIQITAAPASPPAINTGATANLVAAYTGAISGLSISDAAAAGNAILQVTLSDSHGLLNANASGVTVSGANTAKLTLSGTLSAINNALANLTDTNATLGADTINLIVTDPGDGLSGSASQGVNVLPALTLSGLTTAGSGSDASTVNPFANLVLTDNLPQDSVSVSILFSAANGALSGSGLPAATILNNGAASYTLSAASPGQLQQELNALVFTPAAHQVSPGQSVTTRFTLNFIGGGAATANYNPLLTLSSGVCYPNALAADSSGDIFIDNLGNNTVEEFSAGGVLLHTLSNGVSLPYALATDNSGDVFVANYLNNTVGEFSSSGVLIRSLNNGVSSPWALATDSSGNVFVGNQGNNTVEEFSAGGALLRTLSNGVSAIQALATDSGGDVFVANNGNNTVEEFSAGGALLRTLSNGVSGPSALAADSRGDVFVANGNNNNVEEFSASGALLNTLSNGVSGPTAVATDNNGDVFVANGNTNKIEEFSASGALLGVLSNGVSGPQALTADSGGDVWVANLYNNTVGKYAPLPASYPPNYKLSNTATSVQITAAAITPPSISAAAPVTVVAGNPGAINGLSITDASAGGAILQVTLSDSQGLLNAAANGVTVSGANTTNLTLSGTLSAINNALANLTDANTFLGADPISISVADAGDGLSANASLGVNVVPPLALSGLTTAGSGSDAATLNPFANLVLTDNLPQDSVSVNISFTAANGALSGSGLSAAALSNGLAAYTLNAASPAQLQQELNALVFTPTAHQVSPGLGVTTHFTLNFNGGGAAAAVNTPSQTLNSGIASPYALATDSSGDVFVANLNTSTVSELSAGGVPLRTLSSGVSTPTALAVDSGGDVFIANQGNNTIVEFSASGALLRTLSSNVSAPNALATDSVGDVFVANNGANAIEEFSPSGVLLNTLSNGVSGVVALATDSSGDLFVTNLGNNNVEEFSAGGILLRTLSNGMSGPHDLATDSSGDVFVANNGNDTVEEFSATGALLNTLSNGVSGPVALAVDSVGDVFVTNGNTNDVEEFSANGALLNTISNGVSGPIALAADNSGDVFVANYSNGNVTKYAPIPVSYTLSNNATSVQITAAAVINTNSAASVISGAADISAVSAAPLTGGKVTIPDATSFNGAGVTAANVTAAGGGVNSLAGWINGALSVKGADLAQHQIGWFNFAGNTYLVEQEGGQGAAYTTGDTLIKIIGAFNESHANFSAHTLTL